MIRWSWMGLVWSVLSAGAALGQATAFSYQGQLTNAGQPANGSYDFEFALFGAASGGAQIGATKTVSAVPVSNGVFTVQLDFGVSAFPGANRYLEIDVRPAGLGSYTTLAPRQQISSTPYAIRTLSAATADALSSACVGCVTDAQIGSVGGGKITGAIPAASVPTGSGNYIQNGTTQQANSNFNISGNGTVGGNLTVNGTLNANVSGNFIQNRTTPQSNSNFDVSGNGTVGGTLSAKAVAAAGPPAQGTPQLDVDGTAWFRGDSTPLTGHGKGVAIGSNGVDSGYLFAFNYGNSPAPLDLLLNSPGGNVGVGTLSGPPAARLEVDGNAGDAILGIATAANKVGVHGESLSYQGVYGRSVQNAGVVGESVLQYGVFGISHEPTNAGVYGTNDAPGTGVLGETTAAHTTTLSGVYGRSTGNGGVGIIGQADTGNAWGVYGTSASPTGIGVVGNAPGGGWAMAASGNATQTLGNGWIKVIVHLGPNGNVTSCFNAFAAPTAATTPPCGISTTHPATGSYLVTFPFSIANLTVAVWSFGTVDEHGAFQFSGVNYGASSDQHSIDVYTFYVSNAAFTNAPSTIVIF